MSDHCNRGTKMRGHNEMPDITDTALSIRPHFYSATLSAIPYPQFYIHVGPHHAVDGHTPDHIYCKRRSVQPSSAQAITVRLRL